MLDCYNYGTPVDEHIVQNCTVQYVPAMHHDSSQVAAKRIHKHFQLPPFDLWRAVWMAKLQCGKLQILPVSDGKFRHPIITYHYLSSSQKTTRQLHNESITYRNCVFQHSNHWSHLTSLRLMQGVSRAPTNSPRDLH